MLFVNEPITQCQDVIMNNTGL